MSNYCTVSHVRQRIDLPNISLQIEQLSRTNNATEQNTFLEQFMEEACGLIDAHIDSKYTTPVTTAADNAFLRGICLDLTVAELFKRGSGDKIPAKYRENFNVALKKLEAIAEGTLSVPGVASKIKNTSVEVESDTPNFTEDALEKYF